MFNQTKMFLSAVALLFCSYSQADIYNCYQDSFAKYGSYINVTVRAAGGVRSISLSTVTPGSLYSAQLHILGNKLEYQESDIPVIESEGARDSYAGYIRKTKGFYELEFKEDASGKLKSIHVVQDINSWKTDWITSCTPLNVGY